MIKHLVLISTLFMMQQALAEETIVPSNLPHGWTYAQSLHKYDPNIPKDGEGVFNFVSGKIPSADLKIIPIAIPAKLGDDVKAWHALMFSGPQIYGIDVHREITFVVNGQHRYYIEFQTKNEFQINTAEMATVVDGKLVVIVIDMLLPGFNLATKDFRELTSQVELKVSK